MSKFYAVAVGRETGIFRSWAQTESLVKGFRGSKYKSFQSLSLAQQYLDQHTTENYMNNNDSEVFCLKNKVPSHSDDNSLGQKNRRISVNFKECHGFLIGDPRVIRSSDSGLQCDEGSSKSNDQDSCSNSKIPRRSFSSDSPVGSERELVDIDSLSKLNSPRDADWDSVIYTDGSAKNGEAGYGTVRINKTESIITSKGKLPSDLYPNATNNQAELYAIYQALLDTADCGRILIRSDSMYCINALTKWCYTWKVNGWKTSTGGEVLNKDLIEKILEEFQNGRRIVEVKHASGPSGHQYNELAARLANEARVTSTD